MPNLKISQLTSATTPLTGTEVFPIVQSSTTKKTSISNIAAPILKYTFNNTVSTLIGFPVLVTASDFQTVYYPVAAVAPNYYRLPLASTCTGYIYPFISNDQIMNITSQGSDLIKLSTDSGTNSASGSDRSILWLQSDGTNFIAVNYNGIWTTT